MPVCYVWRMKKCVKCTVNEKRKDSAVPTQFAHTNRHAQVPRPSSDVFGVRSNDLTVAVRMSQQIQYFCSKGCGMIHGDFAQKNTIPSWAKYFTVSQQNGMWFSLYACNTTHTANDDGCNNDDHGMMITNTVICNVTTYKEMYCGGWKQNLSITDVGVKTGGDLSVALTFWRRIFFRILAHPVFKMWVIHKPNKVALWNKRHFEEKNGDYRACLKYSVRIFVE